MGLVAGMALAASAFFSEAGPLVVGPWLVLVVAASARARGRTRWECGTAMLAAAVPSMVTLAALSFTGHASRDVTASLEQVAPLDVGGIGTVFPYLDDTLGVSVAKVLDRRPVLSLLVGALLLAMMWFLARRFVPGVRVLARWVLPDRGAQVLWCTGFAGTTLLLFGLGFDWMRWVTSIAFSAMLAAAAVVGARARSPRPPCRSRRLVHARPDACVAVGAVDRGARGRDVPARPAAAPDGRAGHRPDRPPARGRARLSAASGRRRSCGRIARTHRHRGFRRGAQVPGHLR